MNEERRETYVGADPILFEDSMDDSYADRYLVNNINELRDSAQTSMMQKSKLKKLESSLLTSNP